MPSEEKRFTGKQRCAHCGHTAVMEIVGEYSGVKQYDDNPLSDLTWEQGTVYQLLLCPACEGVSLRSYHWHGGWMETTDITFDMLYPGPSECPLGVPEAVASAYKAARKVRDIDANAYGVLLGRVLELVCHDRSADGESLSSQLRDLADRGELPKTLIDVTDGLRNLRNVGAHALLGELTAAEVPILDDLCRAILEYVYGAPFLAKQAEESLKRVRTAPHGGAGGEPEGDQLQPLDARRYSTDAAGST